jgi:hypothetical protein
VHRDDQIGIVERNHHSHPLAFDFSKIAWSALPISILADRVGDNPFNLEPR